MGKGTQWNVTEHRRVEQERTGRKIRSLSDMEFMNVPYRIFSKNFPISITFCTFTEIWIEYLISQSEFYIRITSRFLKNIHKVCKAGVIIIILNLRIWSITIKFYGWFLSLRAWSMFTWFCLGHQVICIHKKFQKFSRPKKLLFW